MCGTSWDTQITVFDPSLTAVAYNDDSCGLQSLVTFTAATTGNYTIQVNTWPCGINFTGAEYFGVTLNSCGPLEGCTDVTACNYDPAAVVDDGSCCTDFCVTIGMQDSWGDGWNGATYSIVDDGGTTVATGSLDIAQSGDGLTTGTDILCLIAGCYTITAGGGTWDGEIFITISGDVSWPVSGGAGTLTFEVDSGCPPQPVPCYDPETSGCPNIDAGSDLVVDCMDPCESLQVSAEVFATGNSNSYEVCQIDYNPPFPFTTGIPFSIGVDDIYTGIITLPFDFCFFGNMYSQVVVGSNNILSFDITLAGGFCPWAFTASCPSNLLPLNSIMGPYHDIDPAVCGDAKWGVFGASPCRTFVVSFDDVCHFLCNSINSTTQIVIYETTNVIEIYIQDKPTCLTWNIGNAVIGVQDATGTTGFAATNRNTGPWSAFNEAWRFTPNGAANFQVDWYEEGVYIATGETIDVCPSEIVQTYDAIATYTMCDGSTIQVQDDVVVNCLTIMLPVEFLYVEGEVHDKANVIKWATASETSNDYFEVQRSTDGLHFETIGELQGEGTTLEEQHYFFEDDHPPIGVAYYKIKQVDFNGEFDYSNTIALEREVNFELASVFPNPFTDSFHVQFHSIYERSITVNINDPSGRTVIRHAYECRKGVEQFELDTRSLSCGFYLLVIKDEHDNFLAKEKLIRK
jgi:hypothetical protein